jgi:hypothetical protein
MRIILDVGTRTTVVEMTKRDRQQLLRAKPNAHGEWNFSTQQPARERSDGVRTICGLKLTRLHRRKS